MSARTAPITILSLNTASARPLQIGERKILTAIGKRGVPGPVAVGKLGLAGDEQVDLSVHGGLDKAVYAYPVEHYPFWQAQRRERGVSLFDEDLPPGFVGENLTISGLLEHEVWIGDRLRFADCLLRVTAPREPCAKFTAVMGYPQAARDMLQGGRCGFYLAVERPGTLRVGEVATLEPGQRGLGVVQAFEAKRIKHLR